MEGNCGDKVFAAWGATCWLKGLINKQCSHQVSSSSSIKEASTMTSKIRKSVLLHWLTWVLNCGLGPVPAVGHPPAGPPWRGLPVLDGATDCGAPFWRDIWASICPAEWAGCAICGVILTDLWRRAKIIRALLPSCHLCGEKKTDPTVKYVNKKHCTWQKGEYIIFKARLTECYYLKHTAHTLEIHSEGAIIKEASATT